MRRRRRPKAEAHFSRTKGHTVSLGCSPTYYNTILMFARRECAAVAARKSRTYSIFGLLPNLLQHGFNFLHARNAFFSLEILHELIILHRHSGHPDCKLVESVAGDNTLYRSQSHRFGRHTRLLSTSTSAKMNELSEQLRCLTTTRRHLLRRMTVDVRGVEHHTRLQQRIAELDRRIEDTRRSMVNVYLAGLYPVHYYISYDIACRWPGTAGNHSH
ncbi:hypothetical protein K438DRAFT_504460 [Mycena galopus ATCC 62051]|nr:hypothetical protein K438DRAFT_504460 [Mycena galopus ATCC 62051]